MRTTEFIKRCLGAGMPLDMALTAAAAFEAECHVALEQLLDARRVKERERQARHRAKKNDAGNVVSRDETFGDVTAVNQRDLTCERPQVVNTPLPSLRSEEIAVAAVVAREPANDWPDGGNRGHARLLIDLVASPWLDPDKSHDLVTTAGRLAAWKRDGASWEHDVVPVVTGLVAKRRSRISTWKYFDPAIAQSIADNRAALSIPEADARPRGQGPPGGLVSQIAAEHAEARRRVLES